MKKVSFWVILLILWIVGSSYCYVCNIKKDCECNKPDYAIPGLTIEDVDFSALDDNNLYFGYGNSNLVVPTCVKRELKALVDHLNENKSRLLILKGTYDSDENGNETLGKTRAESLRTFLVGLGCDANQISIFSKQNNDLTFDPENTRTYGSIEFNFSSEEDIKREAAEKELKSLITSLKIPQVFYYETGSSVLNYNPDISKYISDLSNYLNNYPDSKISIIGHTDTVGGKEMNKKLSFDRANNIKALFLSKDIKESAIELDGRGMDEPASDNDTEEGRSKNRRVEVKLI